CNGFTAAGTTCLTSFCELRIVGAQRRLAFRASLPATRPAVRRLLLSTDLSYQAIPKGSVRGKRQILARNWLFSRNFACTIMKTIQILGNVWTRSCILTNRQAEARKGAERGRTSQELNAGSGKRDQRIAFRFRAHCRSHRRNQRRWLRRVSRSRSHHRLQ